MFYVMTNESNRIIGLSVFGFENVGDNCSVIKMDGDMPEIYDDLEKYIVNESGEIEYDIANYVEQKIEEVVNGVTINDLMDAVLELGNIVASMQEGA